MHQRLTPSTVFLLAFAPLLWAGNSVVGRVVHADVPPMTLNLMRWAVAFVILLPLAWRAFRRDSPLWPRWRYYTLLGLFGVGAYNSLQYLALQTSQALNVTLVGSAVPVSMLLVGRLFFGARVRRVELLGALLSVAGVLVVMSHGSLQALIALRLVPGDAFMVLATISWAFYSWMLVKPDSDGDPLRRDWAGFLAGQTFFGLLWSGLFTTVEWSSGTPAIHWGWPLAAAAAFIGIFPAVIAYRAFGAGVARAGPTVAAFFINLTPLYAAVLSAAFLGETPRAHHAVAFALIVAGIAVSARK